MDGFMKLRALRKCALALLGVGLATSGVVGVAVPAAQATPPPLCIYAGVSGASGDISKIVCRPIDANGYPTSSTYSVWAVWNDDRTSLNTPPNSGDLALLEESAMVDGNLIDQWVVDPIEISVADFKKAMRDAWGYTSIVSGGTTSDGWVVLYGSWTEVSKKKN